MKKSRPIACSLLKPHTFSVLDFGEKFRYINRLQESHWMRNVTAEVSLDFVATGLPKTGDVIGDERFLKNASPWSLSFVMVVPLAPLAP